MRTITEKHKKAPPEKDPHVGIVSFRTYCSTSKYFYSHCRATGNSAAGYCAFSSFSSDAPFFAAFVLPVLSADFLPLYCFPAT